MDLELNDKIAVVTGASKGIGLAITRALVNEGARVVAGARTTASLEQAGRVTPVAIDLMEPTGPQPLVRRAVDAFGRVDILINNLGSGRLRLGGSLAQTMPTSSGPCR